MAGVRTVGTKEVRASLRELLDEVTRGEDVIIQRYGKSIAALIPFEDYEATRGDLENMRLAPTAAEAHEEWRWNRSAAQGYYEVARRWVPKDWWGKGPGWGMMAGFWRIHGVTGP